MAKPRITARKMDSGRVLHIEAPGCIVNIRVGLTDSEGRAVTSVSISADGNRYSGEPQWWIEGVPGNATAGARIVRRDP
jgi:hypothetical protein